VPGSLLGAFVVDPFGGSLASPSTVAPRAGGVGRRAKGFLFFAFAVMADPVSSVAYAIEAPLRALGGQLSLLFPAMALTVGIIALVTLNYWQLVRAFPQAGGSPEAAGRAFGEQWSSFLPIGALVVDFALTIAISIAAAGSAVIAYVPALAPARIPIALGRVVFVAALTWFGHAGRMIFAVMTCLFIIARSPCWRSAGSLRTRPVDTRQSPVGQSGGDRGVARVPGRDGARDGHRSARDVDRAAGSRTALCASAPARRGPAPAAAEGPQNPWFQSLHTRAQSPSTPPRTPGWAESAAPP
jgi:hypothetical protein